MCTVARHCFGPDPEVVPMATNGTAWDGCHSPSSCTSVESHFHILIDSSTRHLGIPDDSDDVGVLFARMMRDERDVRSLYMQVKLVSNTMRQRVVFCEECTSSR